MPKTAIYNRLRAAGLCTGCGKNPADKPSPLCLACKHKNLTVMQARYKRRRMSGSCGQCGISMTTNYAICNECKLKQAARIKKRSVERKSLGLCVRCGTPASSGKSRCDSCNADFKAIAANRKLSGKCVSCGSKPATNGTIKCDKCSKANRVRSREYDQADRAKVLSHYDHRCTCCGETEAAFLTLDHVNDDGAEHRKIVTGNMYRWLVRNNFPPGFQLLCWNCNAAKGIMGGCPHEKKRQAAAEP